MYSGYVAGRFVIQIPVQRDRWDRHNYMVFGTEVAEGEDQDSY